MNTRWIFTEKPFCQAAFRSLSYEGGDGTDDYSKQKKIAQMMKNLSDVPAGEVRMNNGFLNRRLASIQENERHAIDTSIETIYLLRIIVSNINGILANGINLGGIIEMKLPAHQGRQGRFRKTGKMAAQAPHPAYGAVAGQCTYPFLRI